MAKPRSFTRIHIVVKSTNDVQSTDLPNREYERLVKAWGSKGIKRIALTDTAGHVDLLNLEKITLIYEENNYENEELEGDC